MVRALAGDSTMTRFFGTAGSVAPGPSRTLTPSDLADASEEVLVDLQVRLGLGLRLRLRGGRGACREGDRELWIAPRHGACGDLDEADVQVREEEDRRHV